MTKENRQSILFDRSTAPAISALTISIKSDQLATQINAKRLRLLNWIDHSSTHTHTRFTQNWLAMFFLSNFLTKPFKTTFLRIKNAPLHFGVAFLSISRSGPFSILLFSLPLSRSPHSVRQRLLRIDHIQMCCRSLSPSAESVNRSGAAPKSSRIRLVVQN